MPTDRRGHRQLVNELVKAVLIQLLTGSLSGTAEEAATEAHQIVTKPGGMHQWFLGVEALVGGDETIRAKVNKIIDATGAKATDLGTSLGRAEENALHLALTEVLNTEDADLIHEGVLEGVRERVTKAIEQLTLTETGALVSPDEVRKRFAKELVRILNRLRYGKANETATIAATLALFGRTTALLGYEWDQPMLEECGRLEEDLWRLTVPYSQDESAAAPQV